MSFQSIPSPIKWSPAVFGLMMGVVFQTLPAFAGVCPASRANEIVKSNANEIAEFANAKIVEMEAGFTEVSTPSNGLHANYTLTLEKQEEGRTNRIRMAGFIALAADCKVTSENATIVNIVK